MSQQPEILNAPAGQQDACSVPPGSRYDHAHFRSGGQNVCEIDVEYLLDHVTWKLKTRYAHGGLWVLRQVRIAGSRDFRFQSYGGSEIGHLIWR